MLHDGDHLPYLRVMAYAGSRTVNVGFWMLPQDEVAFDMALRESFPDAAWRCSQPGPLGLHPLHLHGTLGDALACGSRGVQAFLHLPVGAKLPSTVTLADGVSLPEGPPVAAAVQLLRSTLRHGRGGTYCDHEASCQHPDVDAHLDAGRLAVRWFENEVGSDTHRVLLEQTRVLRSVLIAITSPAHVQNQYGRRLTGYRIGPAAHAMVQATGVPLGRMGQERFTFT